MTGTNHWSPRELGPLRITILGDEHVDLASVDWDSCDAAIYAHREAITQIPLAPSELARRMRVTLEHLEGLFSDPDTMTLMQRLQVAQLLAETAGQGTDEEDRIAFRRFLARFLDEHVRAQLADKLGAVVSLGVVTNSPAMTERALLDTFVDVGAVELLEHLPPSQETWDP